MSLYLPVPGKELTVKLTKLTVLLLSMSLVAVVAAGCGDSSSTTTSNGRLDRAAYDRISDGMSADEVKAIAGGPQKTDQSSMAGGHSMGGMEMEGEMVVDYWYYQGEKGWVRIELTNARVTGKSGY